MTVDDVAKLDDDLADLVAKHEVPGFVALVRDGEDWLVFSYAQTNVDVTIINMVREWIEKNVLELKDYISKELNTSHVSHVSPDSPASTIFDEQTSPENQIVP